MSPDTSGCHTDKYSSNRSYAISTNFLAVFDRFLNRRSISSLYPKYDKVVAKMCKSASKDIGLSNNVVFYGLDGIILSKKLRYWASVGPSILQDCVFDLSSPIRLLIHSIFLSQNLINLENVETIG